MTNSVYIFGAGASKDFGLPLGAELFECLYSQSNTLGGQAGQKLRTLLNDVEKLLHQMLRTCRRLARNTRRLRKF